MIKTERPCRFCDNGRLMTSYARKRNATLECCECGRQVDGRKLNEVDALDLCHSLGAP
jgi:ribosomal protein L34E